MRSHASRTSGTSRTVASFLPFAAAFAAIAATAARPAHAQDARVCTACDTCTAALAVPGARVELGDDVTASGDACIVIRGEGAVFDALDHSITPAGGPLSVGVRVEARGVVVRNARVSGADIGVLVASVPDVTVFHATLEAKRVGVRVDASEGFHLSRSHLKGGSVGVSFGARDDGTCDGSPEVASPGAVVNRTYVEGASVGVAACNAIPVLTRNTLVRNGVGLLLGNPTVGPGAKGAPYDACLCAPSLPDVKPGTTLFFTTGCSGCEVHEAWMPELRRAKHDIRERETGRENLAIAAKFDAFLDRCAPESTDVLGIPGCVPNYTCLATGVTVKTRTGDTTMKFEGRLQSSDDVARFATECAAAAAKGYREGPSCVVRALDDNVVCANKAADIRGGGPARKAGGAGNACDKVDGWADEGASGCASACPASLPAAPAPVTRAKKAATAGPIVARQQPPAQAAPKEAPRPAPRATASAAARPDAASEPPPSGGAAGGGAPPMVWIVGGAGALGGLFFLAKLLGAKAPLLPAAPPKLPEKPSRPRRKGGV